MKVLRDITEPLLSSGNPQRFFSNVNLATTLLKAYKALVFPKSSGFPEDQMAVIKKLCRKRWHSRTNGRCNFIYRRRLSASRLCRKQIYARLKKREIRRIEKTENIQSFIKDRANLREIIRDGKTPAKVYTIDKQFTRIIVIVIDTLIFV